MQTCIAESAPPPFMSLRGWPHRVSAWPAPVSGFSRMLAQPFAAPTCSNKQPKPIRAESNYRPLASLGISRSWQLKMSSSPTRPRPIPKHRNSQPAISSPWASPPCWTCPSGLKARWSASFAMNISDQPESGRQKNSNSPPRWPIRCHWSWKPQIAARPSRRSGTFQHSRKPCWTTPGTRSFPQPPMGSFASSILRLNRYSAIAQTN